MRTDSYAYKRLRLHFSETEMSQYFGAHNEREMIAVTIQVCKMTPAQLAAFKRELEKERKS